MSVLCECTPECPKMIYWESKGAIVPYNSIKPDGDVSEFVIGKGYVIVGECTYLGSSGAPREDGFCCFEAVT